MEIAIMILCVILSAFFSATETAFNSANKIKLLSLAENGDKRAEKVLDTIEKYDGFLTTILIGNNVVNILLASLATILFVSKMGDAYGSTVSTAVVTVTVLIFGEITPKSLANQAPEKFAMAVVPIVRTLMILFTPLTFIFAMWTKLIYKITGSENDSSITDDELLTIVKEAENEGGLDKNESELIQNAIVFDDRQAEDILTPRVDIVAVPTDADKKEIAAVFSETGYSRLPVYEGSLDNIIGIIHQKDFYEEVIDGDGKIEDVLQSAVFVAPTMKISNLLRELQKEQTHITVVVDEYGGTAGIVTMEDLLEAIVGNIQDEYDNEDEEIVEVSENVFTIDGTAYIEEVNELVGDIIPEGDYDTLGGFLISRLGYLPKDGDMTEVEFENLKFTILNVEDRRIGKIRVEITPKEETDDDPEESKDKE